MIINHKINKKNTTSDPYFESMPEKNRWTMDTGYGINLKR